MKSFDLAIERLLRIKRFDLATLLKYAKYEIEQEPHGFDWVDSYTPFDIRAREPISSALNSLYSYDKKKIIDSVKAVDPGAASAGLLDDNYNIITETSDTQIEERIVRRQTNSVHLN